MDIRKLQRAIVDGLEDVKAQDIVVFNTEHLSPLFERVIIASGTSNRQTKALAASVRDAVKSADFPVLATEGGENGEWIIVDCGAAVAHIMQPSIREYYRLEEIWGGMPVKMKLGAVSKGLVKAESEDDDEDDLPAKKTAAKKAPAKKAAAKTVAAKTAPAKKAGAYKAPAKVAAKKAASKSGVESVGTAAKKAPAKKTAARKTATSATSTAKIQKIVVNAPVKKAAPAKKTGARKTTLKRNYD